MTPAARLVAFAVAIGVAAAGGAAAGAAIGPDPEDERPAVVDHGGAHP